MGTATLEELRERVQARRKLPAPEVRRSLRERAGITRDDIGRVVGVTGAAVRLWELGESEPRDQNLRSYLACLDVLEEAVGLP